MPSQISDLSDEDTHSLQSKTLKITDVSSNSYSDNEELRNMILKQTSRTYGKRKRNNHKEEKKAKQKSEVTVKTCTKREDNKRVWNKKHYCLYCGKSQAKISRPQQRKHMEMSDVAYAFSYPLGSKERMDVLEQLCNEGDFKHNSKVIQKGRGEVVTWKQLSNKAIVGEYLPCPYCFGMYSKKTLWKHELSCKSKKSCASKTRHPRVQSYAARLLPVKHSSKGCQTIINNMRQDPSTNKLRKG